MSSDCKSHYCAAYQTVVFVAEEWIPPAESFTILSACSPTSESWLVARNQVADEELRRRLLDFSHRRVIGQSLDGRHVEPSWAAACSRAAAIQLGQKFRQDAIFWVQGDTLAVVDCAATRPDLLLGSFKSRLNRPNVVRPAPWPSVILSGCEHWVTDSGLQLTRSSPLFVIEYTESIHHSWRRIYSLVSDARRLLWALEESEMPDFDTEDATEEVPSPRLLACMVNAGSEADIAAELWRASLPGGDAPRVFMDETPLGKKVVDRLNPKL